MWIINGSPGSRVRVEAKTPGRKFGKSTDTQTAGDRIHPECGGYGEICAPRRAPH